MNEKTTRLIRKWFGGKRDRKKRREIMNAHPTAKLRAELNSNLKKLIETRREKTTAAAVKQYEEELAALEKSWKESYPG